MPINVSAFSMGTSDCNCYKCRMRKEVGQFESWLEEMRVAIGGAIPRNFAGASIFEGETSITLEQIEHVKFSLNQIKMYNDEKKENIRPMQMYKYAYCVDCGKIHLKHAERKTKYDNEFHFLCSKCARLNYRVCAYCRMYLKKSIFRRYRDEYLCHPCFDAKYYVCSRCDKTHMIGDETRFTLSRSANEDVDYIICPNCKQSLRICIACGHHFFDSERATADRRGMCQQCFSDRSCIKQYSYKPVAKCKTSEKVEKSRSDSLFIGFELELENRSGRDFTGTRQLTHEVQADKLSNIMGEGFIYFKRDGSLNNGFEVVTHPFSWQFYHDNKVKFEEMLIEAYKNGMRAERTCGFHVHMSRTAFGYGKLYKFVKFIYNLQNREFIRAISERECDSSYATYRERDANNVVKFAKAKCNCSQDRHSAVNATGSRTVEVRFFASTTNILSFFKNIEFVFALHEYVGTCSYEDINAIDFLNWLATRAISNKYRNLALWLKDSHIPDTLRRKFRKQLKQNKSNLNLKKGI
jgi:hypothetical protein